MKKLSEKKKAAVETMMKDAIFEAALAILVKHGLDGLTMDRVAEAAEMAKGTLYNYFADKQTLQVYIFGRVSESCCQQLATIRLSQASASEKLSGLVKILFQGFEKNRQVLVILAGGRIHNLKEYHKKLILLPEFVDTDAASWPVEKVLESIISEGIKSQEFQGYDAQLATDAVLGVVTAIIDKQIEENRPRPSEKEISDLIHFVLGGLTNPNL